jgi:ABC-type nitrate/sulfonate/bicarbonate transport system, permease component
MEKHQKLRLLIKYFGLAIVIIAVWEYASLEGLIPPYSLPAPHKIVETFVRTVKDGTLLEYIGVSIARVFSGFALAGLIAIVFGVLISLSDNFEIMTRLILQVLKPIPPIAWIPIAILWLGIGEPSKVFIIFMGAFFPILINTVSGIKQIDERFVEVSRVFEIPPAKLIKKVVIPGALPQIITGLRIGLGNAWICVVAAEMIAATTGIGYMLMDGRQLAQPDKVILAMLLVGIIGKLMDDILGKIEKKLLYW